MAAKANERRARTVTSQAASVVTLEDDLLAVPSIVGKFLAYPSHHVVEPTDVGVDVESDVRRGSGRIERRQRETDAQARGAFFDNTGHMLLYVAAEAGPMLVGPAQRRHVMEIRLAGAERFEFISVVQFAFVARAINHPDVSPIAAIGAIFGEQPLRITAHGSNAGSRGDKYGIGDGLTKNEVA